MKKCRAIDSNTSCMIESMRLPSLKETNNALNFSKLVSDASKVVAEYNDKDEKEGVPAVIETVRKHLEDVMKEYDSCDDCKVTVIPRNFKDEADWYLRNKHSVSVPECIEDPEDITVNIEFRPIMNNFSMTLVLKDWKRIITRHRINNKKRWRKYYV